MRILACQEVPLAQFVFALAFVFVVSVATAQPYAVHVGTQADNKGFVNPGEEQRQSSVKDVKKALAHEQYAGLFTVADDPASADIRIVVAFRGSIDTENIKKTFGRWQRVQQNNLRLDVIIGEHVQEFWALQPGNGSQHAFWSDQAKYAVDSIAKWTRENKAAIDNAQ